VTLHYNKNLTTFAAYFPFGKPVHEIICGAIHGTLAI